MCTKHCLMIITVMRRNQLRFTTVQCDLFMRQFAQFLQSFIIIIIVRKFLLQKHFRVLHVPMPTRANSRKDSTCVATYKKATRTEPNIIYTRFLQTSLVSENT